MRALTLLMPGMAWTQLLFRLWRFWAELRIDVDLPQPVSDLEALEHRWRQIVACEADRVAMPGLPSTLEARVRQVDGEYFVYVIDTACQQLAAYITFNRLNELRRRVDLQWRSPHARVASAYRRCGIVSTVYRWWLSSGRSLVTGARQSPGARALWLSLARQHEMVYVRLVHKRVHLLSTGELPAEVMAPLDVRAVLLGAGSRVPQLVDAMPPDRAGP
jgi:hypothetical protein